MAPMILAPVSIAGIYVIEPERNTDERGYFARTYASAEFAASGLNPAVAECSTSFNARAGTLRGMHYQADPHGEAKLVRCTRGAIYDVALDLRRSSHTYLRWHAIELNEENGRALFIPEGCAHGFQTARDRSEVLYQISMPYAPGAARGVRWNDPTFGIAWPEPPDNGERTISERDASYPDYET